MRSTVETTCHGRWHTIHREGPRHRVHVRCRHCRHWSLPSDAADTGKQLMRQQMSRSWLAPLLVALLGATTEADAHAPLPTIALIMTGDPDHYHRMGG